MNFICLRRSRYPKWLPYYLVTIQGISDTWIYNLRNTESAFLHFCGTETTKFFWVKISKKCRRLPFQILNNFTRNPGLPSKLLGINFLIQKDFLNFVTPNTVFFANFQTWSKTTKMAEKLQKSQNLADLRAWDKNFSPEQHFDWFWHHSDQKKLIFGIFLKFSGFYPSKVTKFKNRPIWPYFDPENLV